MQFAAQFYQLVVSGSPQQFQTKSYGGLLMWYFAWILGVLLACAFGIINVMWMETEEMLGKDDDS